MEGMSYKPDLDKLLKLYLDVYMSQISSKSLQRFGLVNFIQTLDLCTKYPLSVHVILIYVSYNVLGKTTKSNILKYSVSNISSIIADRDYPTVRLKPSNISEAGFES